jgi:sodium transport system permease protein
VRVAWAVVAKELVDLVRDRRALLVGLLLPAVAVPAVSELLQAGAQRRLQAPARVAVVGAQRAPGLLEAGRGLLEPVTVPDPEDALRRGHVDAVLVVPEGFEQALRRGAAELTLKYRAQDPDGLVARERVVRLVAQYALPLVDQTLAQKGLSRNALTPVRVREEPTGRGGGWLGFTVPLFVVVWAFAGAAVVAADLTAGERERGTWDLLLCSPADRWSIVAGKFVACCAAGLALASAAVASQWGLSGARLGLSLAQLGALAAAGLCATWVSASGSLALSLLARSAREANQYALPLYLVALAAAAAAEVLRDWPGAPFVPVLNAFLVAERAVGGSVEPAPLASSLVSSLVAAGALLALARGLLERERTAG